MPKIAFSILLPPMIWLLNGAPDISMPGNLFLLTFVVLHLYAVIWLDAIFRVMRGDAVTYGMLTMSMNLLSFFTTFATAWLQLHWLGRHIARVGDISAYVWGIFAVSLLATLIMPFLANRSVTSLPRPDDRRQYENPCDKY